MITGIFHEGSGIGNQLHRYVFTRVKAKDLGVDFGMEGTFKGIDWMKLDLGKAPETPIHEFIEERVNTPDGVDIREYDPKTEQIHDNTRVDGEFQAEKYFEHRLDEVREWLAVEPKEMPDNVCVINLRGGEYKGVEDLFLPKDYFVTAMIKMRRINPNMEFEIHTDDYELAKEWFAAYPIYAQAEWNWRSIRYAKYLILSNSSFGILPALLGDAKKIYAPKYWARRNRGFWALPQNKYSKFEYI